MPSYPSQSTIKQACRDGHGGSSTPSDSACSNTVKKTPSGPLRMRKHPEDLRHLPRFWFCDTQQLPAFVAEVATSAE